MKIISRKEYEVAESKEIKVILNAGKTGDTVPSELYVRPLDDCTIVVTGFTSMEDDTGIELVGVDIANLNKAETITTAGNYLFLVSSYQYVKIAVTGTANVQVETLY